MTALGAFDGEPAATVLRHAREAGALTTADCLGVKHRDPLSVAARCIPYVDIFMPNEDEALALPASPTPRPRGSACASSAPCA